MSEKDLHSSIEADLKNALQRAISCFGTSPHWVTLYVEPELEKIGLTVVPVDKSYSASKLALRRLRNQLNHLSRKYEDLLVQRAPDLLPGSIEEIDLLTMSEDIETLRTLAQRED